MRRYLLILFGSIIIYLCWAKPDFRYRYWFDSQDNEVVEAIVTDTVFHIDADVSSLSANLHTLHLQIIDEDAVCSAVHTRFFVKMPMAEAIGYKYWFDGKFESAIDVPGSTLIHDIDVSFLQDGLHTITIQPINDIPSTPISATFIKVPQYLNVGHLTCFTFIDGELTSTEVVNTNDGIVYYEIPLGGVSPGLHSLTVQIMTPSGAVTPAVNCYFLRHLTDNEMGNLQCVYSIDGAPSMKTAGQFNSGDYHFDIDVQYLTDDIHNITYMLMSETGYVSDIKTAFFVKTPIGGNGLVMYQYWLNNNEAEFKEVRLNDKIQQLSISDLIPMASQPLRSSNFKFEIKPNGEPWIYARNDFHFRVFGVDGRNVESAKSYTDYAVAQKVEEVTALSGIGSTTIPKPTENSIRWFSISSEIGDSIALWANNACTIQMFSPSGKEVYSAKESDALNIDGVHIYEDGNYYIALHDVTSPNVSDITLNYEHIDKYALLTLTPNDIGVAPGYVHISLLGNGYDKLVNAHIKNGSTELWSNDILVEDRSHATLEFYLPNENVARGNYDIILEFEDGQESEALTVQNAVILSDPDYGNITVEVSSRRSVAKPYPVTVTVTNTGNVAHMMVPLFIGWDDVSGINNFGLLNVKTLLTDNNKEQDPLIITDDMLGKGIQGIVLPLLIQELKSRESIDIVVGYVAEPHTKFNFYAWAYQPWSLLNSDEFVSGNPVTARKSPSQKRAPVRDNPLCTLDPCELLGPMLPDIQDCICELSWGNISLLAGAHLAQYNMWARSMNRWIAEQGMDEYISGARYHTVRLCSPNDILRNIIDACDPTPEVIKIIRRALTQEARRPCPDPTPHHVDVYMPGDPNDMLGYTSPSGSHFISKDVSNIHYTIEFENDPELANASAHHIKITNQIDGSKLDLSTFKPKILKLANRTIQLDGRQEFVTTIDMRPEINSLAQVSLSFDQATGDTEWDIQALDPMTLDPTDDIMQGILPVNDSEGRGLGEIIYDIKLKDNLADGTSIKNSASIIFDQEDAIQTPVWENITDYVLPTSFVTKATVVDANTIIIDINGNDSRSGIWKYEIYMQDSNGEWTLVKDVADTETVSIKMETKNLNDCAFCSVAYDRAGNREDKEMTVEATLTNYVKGDANNDGLVSIADYTVIVNHLLGRPNDKFFFEGADVDDNGIVLISDATSVINILLGNNQMKSAPAKVKGSGLMRYFKIDDVRIDDVLTGTTEIHLADGNNLTSLQFDIEYPATMHVCDMMLNENLSESHLLTYREIAPNKTRVLIYSPSNEILCNDLLLRATFTTDVNSLVDGQTILLTDGYAVECTDTGVLQHNAAPTTALIDCNLSSKADIGTDGLTITTDGLTIIINVDSDMYVNITNALGQSYTQHLKSGENRINVEVAGTYIVNNTKILVY